MGFQRNIGPSWKRIFLTKNQANELEGDDSYNILTFIPSPLIYTSLVWL